MNLSAEELYNPARMKVEYEEKIADWFTIENNQASYIYAFGDRWMHEIKMENPSKNVWAKISYVYRWKARLSAGKLWQTKRI